MNVQLDMGGRRVANMEVLKESRFPVVQIPQTASNGGRNDSGDERSVFHTAFDPDDEPIGSVISECVASIQDKDETDLDPLYYALDPDALEAVQQGVDQVTFEYEELEVVVEPRSDMCELWFKRL